MSNISLKRLQKEYENFKKDPSEDFVAFPIKDDLFCWHFTIRGPEGTEFEGGVYHGVIKLPMSYPYKPPNLLFLTPNGRFDTNMDICLSMTRYHKEEWQAAWTIRSMLEAIIAFMPIKEDHEAIGAVDFPTEIRKTLAKNSQHFKCDECGLVADLLPPKVKKEEPKEKPQPKVDNNEQCNNNSEDINENVSINKPTITEPSFERSKSNKLTQESKALNTLNDLITSPQVSNLSQSQKNEPKQSINNELPLNKQDSQVNKKGQKVNFQEYFKKLHEKEEKDDKKEEKREEKQEEMINTSVPPKYIQDVKKQNIEEDNDSCNESPSTFDSDFAEEFDFYEVQKTIQCHYNKPKIEIEKELNANNASNPSNIQSTNPFKVSKKEKTTPIDFTPKKKNEKEIALLSQLLKKEKNLMKFYSRIQYDKTKKESIKKLNLTMIGIISLVTILYVSVRLVLKKLE